LLSVAWNLARRVSRVGCVSGITATGTTFCVLCLVLRCLMRALNNEMRDWMTTCIPVRGKHHREQYLCSRRLITLRFCFGRISEISAQLNIIYGLFILLSLAYHNTFFHLEALDALRNIYNYVVYNISPESGNFFNAVWLIVDGVKIVMYFFSVSLFVVDYKRFKVTLCVFTNGLPSCNLRKSVIKTYVSTIHFHSLFSQLHYFSLEATSANLKFTAFDFFTFSWELLFSVSI